MKHQQQLQEDFTYGSIILGVRSQHDKKKAGLWFQMRKLLEIDD